mgnify:CR=1 FL=1
MENNEKMWGGEFGKEYTERQNIDINKESIREEIFKKLFKKIDRWIGSVLEVGANSGHNLSAIGTDYNERTLVGVEINKDIINGDTPAVMVIGSAYNLPFIDNAFELVFTSGVLIHLEDTLKAMKEIYRVSHKYILSIEYFDDKERKIEYRDGVYCSAKPFDRLWLDNFDLDLVELGNMKDFGFDDGTDFSRNCKYAIFKKP